MNINMWQWFLKQTRTNQLILVFAIAASTMSSMLLKVLNDRGNRIRQQNVQIMDLNVKLVGCEQRSGRETREILEKQLNDEKERGRKSDSMYYAISAAKMAVKKASNDDNR